MTTDGWVRSKGEREVYRASLQSVCITSDVGMARTTACQATFLDFTFLPAGSITSTHQTQPSLTLQPRMHEYILSTISQTKEVRADTSVINYVVLRTIIGRLSVLLLFALNRSTYLMR